VIMFQVVDSTGHTKRDERLDKRSLTKYLRSPFTGESRQEMVHSSGGAVVI
jgi:hypothetical protein